MIFKSSTPKQNTPKCCEKSNKKDYIFITLLITISLFYIYSYFFNDIINIPYINKISLEIFNLINIMWYGILIGILMISILSKIPKEFISSLLGTNSGIKGILRATIAGVLLDLCSHGILMIGAKFYQKGASIGQVMAFLIASPWNSFSLTIILISLIGLFYTLLFIVLSMIIAIITGIIFDKLVQKNILPSNNNQIILDKNFNFKTEAKKSIKNIDYNIIFFKTMLINGLKDSKIVIKWLLIGVIIASLIKTFISTQYFSNYLGPTIIGLIITMFFATILEICSEGSAPIGADILNRAKAPGNSFAFLMGGVSTDYTEIAILKNTTKSLKIALFLPLITLPQIILLGYIINII